MPDVSQALKAKIAAWRRQHAALNSPAYRITLKSRRDGLQSFNHGKGRAEGQERFYSADDVEQRLAYLSRQNAKGYDIYITPIDSGHHYLVVDDMHGDALQRLRAAGYQPALVQESSADNQQAVLKISRREDNRSEQSAANALVVELNREYGDPNFSGVVHPFRTAGFANKKPGRGNAFTKILEATGILCPRAVSRLEEIRSGVQVQPSSASRGTGSKGGQPPPDGLRKSTGSPDREPSLTPTSDATKRFAQLFREWKGLVREKGWKEDLSRIDWQVTLAMLRDGWDPSDVRDSILAVSPRMPERHANPFGYAFLTVSKANAFLASAAAARGGGVAGKDAAADELDDFFRLGPATPDPEPR